MYAVPKHSHRRKSLRMPRKFKLRPRRPLAGAVVVGATKKGAPAACAASCADAPSWRALSHRLDPPARSARHISAQVDRWRGSGHDTIFGTTSTLRQGHVLDEPLPRENDYRRRRAPVAALLPLGVARAAGA